MIGAQGPNIAEVQAHEDYKKAAGEKSGFGLGHGDSVSTIVDGARWWFSLLEKVINAYPDILGSLFDGSSLDKIFGKPGNMFGLPILEDIEEFFSGGGGEGVPPEGMDKAHEGPLPEDYHHTSNKMADDLDGLGSMHYEGNHPPGGPVSPGFSPSVGDDHHPDHRPELGG
ncbi:hypothetical protein [Wolbachia endosymbiont of Cantharis cryptica]|uniref:hypothetical protein n=1 Tax=Wolbachia endosymbiont of Cantharis cryptica TaxID=3066132 RepID=UPI00376EF0ED